MKYILFSSLVVLLFLMVFFSHNSTSFADTATGLVGYWTFDEASGTIAADSSGNNNNGTLTNGPTWTTGKIGSAVNFDNINDTITFSTAPSLNLTGAITVSAWINKTSGFSASDSIVSRFCCGHSAPYEQYSLMADTSASSVKFNVSNGTALLKSNTATNAIQNGTWYHLVGTYNGTDTTAIYLNGVLVDSDTSANFGSLNVPNGAIFRISPSSYFGGVIDEVRVYNRALSASDVTELYNFTGAPPDTEAPSTPTDLSANSISSSEINLSWTTPTDNFGVTGYRVYRCEGAGCTPSTQINTSATTSYSDIGLYPTTTYVYAVAAYDAADNLSLQSAPASATTQPFVDTTPPVRSSGSPSGSLASGTTSTTISLATDENATCKYSAAAGVSYSSMTDSFSTTSGTSHSSTVSNLSDGQTYNYYVRCEDSASNANTDDYLISFSITDPNSSEPILVDLYIDAEAGSPGEILTTSILNGATHGSGGVWSIASGSLFTVSASNLGVLARPVSVAGVVYDGIGDSQSWDYNHTIDKKSATYRLTNKTHNKASLGAFFKIGPQNTWGYYDFFIFSGYLSSGSCVAQLRDLPSAPVLHSHSVTTSGPQAGADIAVLPNVNYWITLQYDTINGLCSLAVFDPVTWQQIGATSISPMDTNIGLDRILVGVNGHGATSPTHSFFDNIIVDWTEGKFPLGTP
ncbi:MAG: hypothetical protein A2660_02180 [Candidatus Doudnabacteria bacterium RIFCSPHIGHO2_01_FULL_45_18]|uniref:Fibronectin type-III domain-containing protein n=1 Tax=Candidatus Doudnabacteria bacterium RIFCSPHIGHO2_01_FULL_45_18 TaxID=1817823 RepID=A0A1F5NRZ0_9BACT|nr:MAG: hypothetical protein A2660_02180 [Candidatus Doudnabacteria bacterium RIFCSPHIGHO2_01_FULL_45_18]